MDTKYLRPHYLVLFCHATLVLCQFTPSVPESATEKLIDIHPNDTSSSIPSEPIIHDLFSHLNPSNATSTPSPQPHGNETNKISEMQNMKNMSLLSEGGPVNISPSMRTNTKQEENSEFSKPLDSRPTPATLEEGLSPVISSNVTDTLKKPLLTSDQTSDSFPENHHHHQTIGRKGAFDPTINNQSTSNQPCIDNKGNNCYVAGNESSGENTTLTLLNQGLEKNNISMKTENISLSPEIIRPSPNVSSVSTNYIFLGKHNLSSNSSEELKKKPTFTLDDKASKQQSLLSSPESKYIIPVVATILVVPLVVALLMFLYRRGAEFWERRHYRRMDFLIDGMYND
ncbi:probable serine/threonine-protein kinase DDB_G0272254 [Anabrus simplex]|uniref:probable serine/threonine-protein kinase DDB_G0272254 n=1 Tax=Anabrus simplex TaxID=316456 RepID=UPI0035A27A1B